MGKKQTKKNKKKNKKKKTIEGESSAAAEKAVSSERNSSPEPEATKLGDTSPSSAGNGKKFDGGDTKAAEEEKEETPPMTERERIEEEDSWIVNQDSSERKPSTVLFAKQPIQLFATKLDAADADPALNRVALRWCHERMLNALLLTQNLNKTPYVSVLARDPQKREYQLRFSGFEGTVALSHEWDKIVDGNGLKEGDIVLGRGCYIGGQYRMVLSFTNITVEDVSRERKNLERTFFLFEKKLDEADLKQRLVISCCNERLKIALEITMEPYVSLFAKGAEENELYELMFSRDAADQGGETFILHHDWESVVAQHGLEEGDLLTAFGNLFSLGFLMFVCVFKKGETGIPMLSQTPIMIFQKKLEASDTNDRLVIESCKDVVKEIVARAEEVAGSDGYVRVYADDEGGRVYELRLSRDIPNEGYVVHHQWRDFVASNGLMSGDTVSCWGGLHEDGTIHVTFDVVKALENLGLEHH